MIITFPLSIPWKAYKSSLMSSYFIWLEVAHFPFLKLKYSHSPIAHMWTSGITQAKCRDLCGYGLGFSLQISLNTLELCGHATHVTTPNTKRVKVLCSSSTQWPNSGGNLSVSYRRILPSQSNVHRGPGWAGETREGYGRKSSCSQLSGHRLRPTTLGLASVMIFRDEGTVFFYFSFQRYIMFPIQNISSSTGFWKNDFYNCSLVHG